MNGESKNQKIIGGTLATTALLTGVACGPATDRGTESAQAAGSPAPVPTDSPASPSPTGATPAPTGVADLKRAAQAALDAVPGSTLVSIESEENGRLWEVQVIDQDGTEHQMDVEASSGEVVNGPTTEEEDPGDKAEHRERVEAAKVDYAQAADKIAAAVPEGRITELNLDTSGGKTVWEADVAGPDGTKQEVSVDAASGEVTRGGATS